MTLLRPLLVCLTALSLLALPGTVSASTETSHVWQARVTSKAPFATRVAFLSSDHVRRYGSVTAVRGQVLTDHGAGEGSIAATVDLLRRYRGSTSWETIRHVATTMNSTAPRFAFEVRTNANAYYKVVYAGDDQHAPSDATTQVWAYRAITTEIKPRLLQVSGKVAPNYAGKRMFIERKKCATCRYVRLRSTVVTAKSTYMVTLTAPAHGRWFWRLTVPASTKFIVSHGNIVTTTRR